MKKPVTFRFDPELLIQARQSAEADHRSLTNFVETALRQAIDRAIARRSKTDAKQRGNLKK